MISYTSYNMCVRAEEPKAKRSAEGQRALQLQNLKQSLNFTLQRKWHECTGSSGDGSKGTRTERAAASAVVSTWCHQNGGV